MSKRFVRSAKRADRLCGSPSLLFMGYQGLYLRG